MFLICVLRGDTVGFDTAGYKSAYLRSARYDWNDFDYIYFENGYILFMKIFSKMDASFEVFKIAVYSVVFIPLYFFLKRFSKDVTFSLLIYICYTIFTFNLTGIRNSMAMSICLLAYLFLEKKTTNGFFISALLVLLAFFFHKSSIVFVLAYVIVFFPFNKRTMFVYVLVTAFVFFQPDIIFNFITDTLERTAKTSSLSLGGSFLFFLIIEIVAFAVIALYNHQPDKLRENPEDKQSIEQLKRYAHFIYFTLLSFLLVGGASTMIRASIFFQIFCVVILPECVSKVSKREQPIVKFLFIAFLLVFYYLTVLKVKAYDVVPYHFYWEQISLY